MAYIQAGDWTEPWVVAFEYGGVNSAFQWRSDPAVTAAQVPRLRTLATGNGRFA